MVSTQISTTYVKVTLTLLHLQQRFKHTMFLQMIAYASFLLQESCSRVLC